MERIEEYPDYEDYGGECLGVYYLRLMRDGWEYKSDTESGYESVTTFEKRINDHWTLRKFAYGTINQPVGKGCYYDRHEIENVKTGEKVNGAEWEWADVDRSRVVWAQEGKLFSGQVNSREMSRVVELHDFNTMEYERLKAPY